MSHGLVPLGSSAGKDLAEIALEEERGGLGDKFVVPAVGSVGAELVAGVMGERGPGEDGVVERAKTDQHALGAGELEIAIDIEAIGPFAAGFVAVEMRERAGLGQRIMEGLHRGVKGSEDGEVRHPDGAGRKLDAALQGAGAEELSPISMRGAGTRWDEIGLEAEIRIVRLILRRQWWRIDRRARRTCNREDDRQARYRESPRLRRVLIFSPQDSQ